ncbi:DUF4928 family protein [Nitratidesulfovibrio termitidis]|uniref:DUF4928 family protein n=1 Tax=Nitratidesulfovibrio termitidis TaxID=42252 RepID=UPI000A0163AA|nr:DUF4928 family protein [Nitratidesulfovibrio termitidis]
MTTLEKRLIAFRDENSLKSKGQLAVMLHITRLAIESGLPIDPEALRTDKEGQVKGLGKSRVQNILRDHGITRVLAEEGGRTSRGSLGAAAGYAFFLNALHREAKDDLPAIEKWWISRVQDYFTGKPFVLKFDSSKSLRSIVGDLLAQAMKRQKDNPGTTYAGTVLQHLVGAKLDLILPEGKRLRHHGANVADGPTARTGDFVLDDVVIHVTTAPSEGLIRKCKANIEASLRPIIVTVAESRAGVESIAKGFEIDGRIDVIEVEQFIATNILEWSKFTEKSQRLEVERLISKYNEIVYMVETDPSLTIQIGAT